MPMDGVSQSVNAARTQEAILDNAAEAAQLDFEAMIGAEATADELKEEGNPLARLGIKEKKAEERTTKVEKKTDSAVVEESKLIRKEAEDMADQFARDNPWIKPKDLMTLLDKLNPGDSRDTILKYVFAQYPDLNEASKALEFLAKTTGSDLQKEVQAAQEMVFGPIDAIDPNDSKTAILEKLEAAYPYPVLVSQALDILAQKSSGNTLEQVKLAKEEISINFGRDIQQMKSSKQVTTELKKVGIYKTPVDFKEEYNQLLTNPKEFHQLNKELKSMVDKSQKQAYLKGLSFVAMTDVNMEGADIDPAKLQVVIDQLRTRYMSVTVSKECEKGFKENQRIAHHDNITLPPQVTPESIEEELLKVTEQRYPSEDHLRQSSERLGFRKVA